MKHNFFLNRKSPKTIWQTFLLIIMFLVCSQNSIAQLVNIPAANTNSDSSIHPLGSYFGYQRSAMIYTVAEIGLVPGAKITTLAFFHNSYQNPNGDAPVIIRMSNTTQTTFAASNFASEIVGATTVLTAILSIPSVYPSPGRVQLSLNTPFVYTGNNIKITVETNAGGTGNESVGAKQYRWSAGQSQIWQSDNVAPSGLGTVNSLRPNIELGYVLPPANDSCFNSLIANSLPYSNVQTLGENATNNNGFLNCANPMNDGVWYRFVGTGTNVRIELRNVDLTFDPQIDAYIGNCNSLSCVGSQDSAGAGGNETLLIATTLNIVYFINVGQFSGTVDAPEGNFKIDITDTNPIELYFDLSSDIVGYEGETVNIKVGRSGSLIGTTTLNYEPNDGSANGNIDYGPALGTLTWLSGENAVKTIPITLLNDALVEPLEKFNLIFKNPVNGTNQITSPITIRIIDTDAVPANDACDSAINAVNLPYSNVQTLGQSSTNNNGFLTCTNGMNDGLWYRFIGNGSSIKVKISNVDADFDPQLDIYSGVCGLLDCFSSTDLGFGEGLEEEVTFTSVLGTPYYVNVGDYRNTSDFPEGNFKIDITTTALSNNNFEFKNLKMFPNPVTNILNIENTEKIESISISNLLGQELMNQKNNDLKTQIDLSSFQNGAYLVKVNSENREQVFKIYKSN